MTICRFWRGWATPENADAYERLLRGEVIPGIEARRIEGFQHIDMMRRDLGAEVEFATIMWFDDIASIKAFVGEDYEVSHVPPRHGRCSPGSTTEPRITRYSTGAGRLPEELSSSCPM